MAVSDTGSLRANVADSVLLRGHRAPPLVDEAIVEPEISGKWHPAKTLGFIVVSCGLLWAGIFAGFALLF